MELWASNDICVCLWMSLYARLQKKFKKVEDNEDGGDCKNPMKDTFFNMSITTLRIDSIR